MCRIQDKVLVRNKKRVRGALRRPLCNNPSMDKWKCNNMFGQCKRAHKII